MAVVIGEFQAVAEPPAAQQQGTGSTPADVEGAPAPRIEPALLGQAQRAMHLQTLRVWAH